MKYRPEHSLCRGAKAFTLIEIMLGLMISMMILGACAVVFSTALHAWESGSEARQALQTAQTISDLIERHLRSAMPPEDRMGGAVFVGEDLSEGDISGHRLTLLSTAPGRFPRSAPPTDCSEIEFCFDPNDESGEPALKMRIDATPDDDAYSGGETIPLSQDVVGFQVQYCDGTDWYDDWDEQKLPAEVEFSIVIALRRLKPGETAADLRPGELMVVKRTLALPRAGAGESDSSRQLRSDAAADANSGGGGGGAQQ